MKAGFHSPLPPARTGVADYAAALLGALRRQGEVEVDAQHADVHLYHIGNNHLHWPIYQRALRTPGVIVLHDAVLHHLMLGQLAADEYVDEFVYNYGEWYRELARNLWAGRKRSGADRRYFNYPMIRRLVEASRRVVVHNPGAAAIVARHAPAAVVEQIPHLYVEAAEPPGYVVERLRAGLGIRPHVCLFGVFGHLRESKRVLPLLRVFRRLRAGRDDVALLVAGDFASSDLERAAQPLLDQPGLVRFGYTPDEQFRALACGCDAAVNLRYPAAGETSGITIRLMGAGRPVIVTAGPETSMFPGDCVLRVDPGPAEEEMLEAMMAWLAASRDARLELGGRAADYIREYHSLDLAAERYWRVLLS